MNFLALIIGLLSIPFAAIAFAIIAYVIAFWIRYSWVRKMLGKWSKEEFIAPEKRYGKLMLHGLGIVASLALSALIIQLMFMCLENVSDIGPVILGAFYILVPCSFLLYWYIVYKVRMKSGASKRLVAFEVMYGFLTFSAWAAIVVLAIYAIMAAVILVVCYFLFRIIMYFCFAEQISVKSPGLFGGTKKVWAERNLDGTYTDIEGNKYKKK